MSGRKNVLAPEVIALAQSLASSFTSTPTMIPFLDNCAYQINVTTSDSTGTFAVEGSVDYVQATAMIPGNTGNWIPLTLGGATANPVANAANDNIIINLNQVPFNALRIRYTSTVAGTGTATIYFMSKMI